MEKLKPTDGFCFGSFASLKIANHIMKQIIEMKSNQFPQTQAMESKG